MNRFIETYQRKPADILNLIKQISGNLDVKTISDFCEAEYQLFSIFQYERDILDVSGTGGAEYDTVNVGTISAFILASLDIPVAKLSFPSYSGSLGSENILKKYGIPIRISREEIFKDLDKFNLCFLQREYSLEGLERNKKTAEIANMMPRRSIFRLLGPLCHPLKPDFRVYGLAKNTEGEAISCYLRENTKRYMVVSGKSGIDEVDICESTDIWENDGSYSLDVETLGLKKESIKDIQVGNVKSEELFLKILNNQVGGPLAELVLINVAAGIKVVRGTDWEKSYKIAEDELKSGRPFEIFRQMSLLP
ncbi:MAG: hypothetical protein Q7S53_01460 [bacterium]|nr:hypothetical protein [bacterium]